MSVIRYLAAVHREGFLVRSMARVAKRIEETLNAPNHDFRTNGELNVLGVLGADAREILDVGANSGQWAQEAARLCPYARIHCFEVCSAIRQRLHQVAGTCPSIVVASHGLSDQPGQVEVKYVLDADMLTSFFDYPHPRPFKHVWIWETVERGDAYLQRHGIEQIDFLKIDTEGAEHLVLKGFGRSVAEGRISMIQFEYGQVNILSRFLLKEHYELLESYGYLVGKIHPKHVAFKPYRLEDEDFRGPNYLAVLRERQDLIARLSDREVRLRNRSWI